MRLNKVAFAFVLGFCFCAQADDNVFVDLSVLDNLNGAYVAPREPLFPVLPKKEKKVKPQKASVKKAVAKKKQPAPVVEVKADKEPAVELPKQQEIITEPEVVVVDVEPVEANNKETTDAEVAAIEPIEAEVIETEQPATEEKPEEKVEEAVVEASVVEQVQLLQPAKVINADAEPNQGLLIDENTISEATGNAEERSIVFAEGEDELTPEQMAKIDDIIGRFKDVSANKIAIYSYNLDDGVDSFRKKRVSLNRAVGIRGYLIKQGYKNFSIKVININSGSDKINTVELEEI